MKTLRSIPEFAASIFLTVMVIVLTFSLALADESHVSSDDTLILRGDTTGDLRIGIEDAIFTLKHLYHPGCTGYCASAGDWDGDEAITAGDAIQCLTYLYQGSCPPVSPFPSCGKVESSLSCHAYTACN